MTPNQSPSPVDSTALITLEPSCPWFPTPTAPLKPFSSLQSDPSKLSIRPSSQSSGWRAKLLNPTMAHKALHVLAHVCSLRAHPSLFSFRSGEWEQMCRSRTRIGAFTHSAPPPWWTTVLLPQPPILLLFIQLRPTFHTVLRLNMYVPVDTHPTINSGSQVLP